MKKKKYKMTISRLTVDKLGVKLYDRVYAVIAETIANCYDADATKVKVVAPMGEMLASKSKGKVQDKGYAIEIVDNGIGMTAGEVNEFYLPVGAERRSDPRRGNLSKIFKRKVMGRKGVGKIAPFGVCEKLEIISCGGNKKDGQSKDGKKTKGYEIAHLILDRTKILKDTDTPYFPDVGELDGLISKKRGTIVKLKVFDHRRVSNIESFERQLAQRFGIVSPNWQITLIDALKSPSENNRSRVVGEFAVGKMPNTEIRLEKVKGKESYYAVDPDGDNLDDVTAGFEYEGKFYPVTGWVAYSKSPYKDDLMAGIRIYCRGKIAAKTHIFNMKAGFTGEYDIRSYLVGELHADWLDEDEDLIRTDRQDILWSHELGREFEAWGQALVRKIGVMTRGPKRKTAWALFEDISDIHDVVDKAFPRKDQREIRDNTLEIAKVIAQTTREDELQDKKHIKSLVGLSLLMGPHITLDRKLREAAESKDDPLSVITSILKTARVAELAAFGKIAEDRVQVIKKIEKLKDDPKTLEGAFQCLISDAPWLIDPQWAPITANQSFATLKQEFQKYYKKKTGRDLELDDFSDPKKQCDFVLASQDSTIQIIEIKKPDHAFDATEMDRVNSYVEIMNDFLNLPGNEEFKQLFPSFRVTLVCDKISLKGVHKRAFEGLKKDGTLTHITWRVFLLRTRRRHEDFLKEAERQKKDAAKEPKS